MRIPTTPSTTRPSQTDRWWMVLTAVLGAYYVALGADALPKATGLVGIAGGLAIWGALRLAQRSHRLAVGLLVVGALAFAIVTWWSVITPVLALLVLVIGAAALRRPQVPTTLNPVTVASTHQ